MAEQRSRDLARAVRCRRPRYAFRQLRARALARGHLASRRSQRFRRSRHCALGGSTDAAAVDGPRSRSFFAAEEAVALTAWHRHFAPRAPRAGVLCADAAMEYGLGCRIARLDPEPAP